MYCKCVFTHSVFKMALWFLTVDDFGSPRRERKAAFTILQDLGETHVVASIFRTHSLVENIIFVICVLISTVIPICISNAYICTRCTNRVTGIKLKSRARQLFISWCDRSLWLCPFPSSGKTLYFIFYCSRVCVLMCMYLCLILHMHIHGHKASACWKVWQKWGLVVFKSSLTIPVENK